MTHSKMTLLDFLTGRIQQVSLNGRMSHTKVSPQVSINGAEQLSNFSELTFDRGGNSAVCGLSDLTSMFQTPFERQGKLDMYVKLSYES